MTKEERKRERDRKYQKDYRAKNKEKLRDYQRDYKEKNRKRLNARELERYHKNPGPHRARHLKSKYGITPAQWDGMFAAQGNSCAICHTQEKPAQGWHTDHCHATGAVRGILCSGCNTALGGFKDNPSTLASAISYLKVHNGKSANEEAKR